MLKILQNEQLDLEMFGITMTLFHYYTYYKSFKNFDKFKLLIGCLFLSGKIKGIFIKLEELHNFYKKYSPKNQEITDKEIMGFELDLLIFLGFEIDIETSFQWLERILKKINISRLLNTNKISTESTCDTEIEKKIDTTSPINNNLNNSGQRVTKIIESTGRSSSMVLNLTNEYFVSMSKDDISDKIKSLSYNILCDVYRRPLCIVFRPKCLALCSILVSFNIVVDSNMSDYYLDLKYFFDSFYEEGNFEDFISCFNEVQKLML